MRAILMTIGKELTLAGQLGTVPAGSAASSTLTPVGGVPPYTTDLQSSTLPPEWMITVNADGSVDVSTLEAETPGEFTATFLLEDSERSPAVIRRSLRVIALPLQVTGTLPPMTVGVPYSASLAITGGTPPYSLPYVIGAVSGINTSIVGDTVEYSGTPSGAFFPPGYEFSIPMGVTVEDSVGVTASWGQTVDLNITPLELTGSLGGAEEGVAYADSLSRAGGVGNVTVTSQSGFPSALTATADNANDQVDVAGTPAVGTSSSSPYAPSVTITDENGNTATWSDALTVEVVPNLIALPLTYDEVDYAGTMTWVRQGNGPHVTPLGFEGDGYEARLKSTTIPAWMTSASAKLTLQASIRFYPQQLKSTSEFVVYAGEDDSSPIAKLVLTVLPDATNTSISQLAVRGGTGGTGFVEKLLGRSSWKYQFRAPDLTIGGYEVRLQAILFLDADTLILSGHFEDTVTRVWKINPATAAVLGYFDCTGDWEHIGLMARRSNGDVWVAALSQKLCKVDLDASFAAGTMVFSNVISYPTFEIGGLEFVTVSGTEYMIAVQYVTSGTPYFYVFPVSVLGNTTLAPADRYKRFTGPAWETQGACMRSGKLITSSNDAVGGAGAQRWGHVHRFDLVTAIGSTADGGALPSEARWDHASKYAEDIAVHPVTNDLWGGLEGITAVGSDAGGLSVWSSALDGALVENHYTVEYDGAGTTTIKVNGRAYDTMPGTLAINVDCVTIGGPPATAAGMTARYFTGYVSDVVVQDQPMSSTGYARAISGYYEPDTLTAYTFTLTNPGAESGSATGWTAESGGVAALLYPSVSATVPHSGSYFFSGGTSATTIARQRFDIAAQTGLSGAQIDAGGIWAKVRWWQASIDATQDPAGMGLRTLTSGLVTQSTVYSGIAVTPNSSGTYRPWYPRAFAMNIPTSGRHLDAIQRMNRSSGTNNDGWIDDITVTVYRR